MLSGSYADKAVVWKQSAKVSNGAVIGLAGLHLRSRADGHRSLRLFIS